MTTDIFRFFSGRQFRSSIAVRMLVVLFVTMLSFSPFGGPALYSYAEEAPVEEEAPAEEESTTSDAESAIDDARSRLDDIFGDDEEEEEEPVEEESSEESTEESSEESSEGESSEESSEETTEETSEESSEESSEEGTTEESGEETTEEIIEESGEESSEESGGTNSAEETTEEESEGSSGGNGTGDDEENWVDGGHEDTATSTPSSTDDYDYGDETIKDTHIDTGDATAGVGTGNSVNNNVVDNGGDGGPVGCGEGVDECAGDVEVGNSGNGEDSENDAGSTVVDEEVVENDNDADIGNEIEGVADSGSNSIEAEGADSKVKHSSITTGNADAAAGVANTANTNEVYTGGGSNSGADWPWMKVTVVNEDNEADSKNSAYLGVVESTSVINENNLNLYNDVELEANSGDNLIAAGYKVSDNHIDTGDASALANIFNFANVNWIDSGVMPYIRNMGSGSGDINLSQLIGNNYGTDSVKQLFVGNSGNGEGSTNYAGFDYDGEFLVSNTNSGEIINNVALSANSGFNKFMSDYKVTDSSVKTGDVYAAANVFNFLNANFVNANFLFSVVNIFGDYVGDLFLPGQEELFGSGSGYPAGGTSVRVENSDNGEDSINDALVILEDETTINNDNTAHVANNIETTANTGDNDIEFGYKAKRNSVTTGDSESIGKAVNLVNQNVMGGTWYLGMFNFFGNWYGGLYNSPDGSLVQGGPQGFVISADGRGTGADCEGCGAGTEYVVGNTGNGADSENYTELSVSKRTDIENLNDANIENNISLLGNTGENVVDAGYKAYDNSVETGNAKAVANVANFANLNFMNTNVVVTIFNVFGDFAGDILFGTTDLGLGYGSDKDSVSAGDTISYSVDYSNNGDGNSEGAQIVVTYDPSEVVIVDAGGGTDDGSGTITWEVGSLAPGEGGSVSYVVMVLDGVSGDITSSASVSDAGEADDTTGDNSASLTIGVSGGSDDGSGDGDGGSGSGSGGSGSGGGGGSSGGGSGSGGSGGGGGTGGSSYGGEPNLVVTKTARDGYGPYYPGDVVFFTVEVANTGWGAAFDVKLYDQLSNIAGDVVYENSWPIDIIYADQQVVVEYTLTVPPDVAEGEYTNMSMADGFDDWHNLVTSNESQVTLLFLNNADNGGDSVGGSSDDGDEGEGSDGSGGSDEELAATTADGDDGDGVGGDFEPTVLGASLVNTASAGELGEEEIELALAGFGDDVVLGSKVVDEGGTSVLLSWEWIALLALLAAFAFYLLFAWRRRREDSEEMSDFNY